MENPEGASTAVDLTEDEYRKMLLVMLIRRMNEAWSDIEKLYQKVPPEYSRDHAPAMTVIDNLGVKVLWPHPETTSPHFVFYEYGIDVKPGQELPDPGAWVYVGDELTRILLTLSEGRPTLMMQILGFYDRLRQWAQDEAAKFN